VSDILEVDAVTKAFGGVRAVDGASFRLAAPGIYGLIGPNGAGKTTLFDVICGRQFADTGQIHLAGRRIDRLRVHQRARLGLARTFQECRVLEEETCLDNLLFAAQDKHLGSEMVQALGRSGRWRQDAAEEAERLLDLVSLRRFKAEPAGNLSYGQRRLVEIVSSLITGPRLLLLDEPASGINPTLLNVLRDFLLRIFAERQIVLLIVEHNMEFIMSLASHVLVMHQGRVLEEGPPAAIQASRRVIEAYLG
jgi:ABC-type branched-subunit amino acid transport system ATPase component